MLCFYCTQTHMKLQPEFSRDFFRNNFRPFAAPSKCRPVRPAPPAHPSLRLCSLHTRQRNCRPHRSRRAPIAQLYSQGGANDHVAALVEPRHQTLATVSSCRESNSHHRSGRHTDKTVLSCLAWRCELALRRHRNVLLSFVV